MRWGCKRLLKPLVLRIWAKCKGGIKQLRRNFYPQNFIQTALSSSFMTIPSQAGKGKSWENFLALSSHELVNSPLPPRLLWREQTDPFIPMRKTVEGKVKHIVVVVVESGGSAQSYPLDGPSWKGIVRRWMFKLCASRNRTYLGLFSLSLRSFRHAALRDNMNSGIPRTAT